MERSSGVLMAMSSLPSPYGIGTMGKSAYEFVDFLKAAGQKYWQLLPLGPASAGDSPYTSYSTFAGNPYYIDLDLLAEAGLLRPEEPKSVDWGRRRSAVDYGKLYENRLPLLRRAYTRGRRRYAKGVERFCRDNPWVETYALYMALKAQFGMLPWTEWPEEDIRMHRPEAVRRWSETLRDEVDFHIFVQFLFFRQWDALRAYAHKKGISLIGDIPIYVALDSADVWSEPKYFQLDSENVPKAVAGVPPDAFTADGQLWGNPLYDWDEMEKDGYGWWIRRIEGARKLYDCIRIDHFRGLESYWSVPYGETTAINGVWKPGPGMKLVGVLTSWFYNIQFIAEDLGYLTPEVRKLVADSGLPGMKIMEFAFDAHGDSDYLPHNCLPNSVCYLGTHDNDTVRGWLSHTRKSDRAFAARYMNITDEEGWCWGMIRAAMASASNLFVVQMQDLLELSGAARMNTPGVPEGNWRWRMKPGAASPELAEKLRVYTKTFRRL
ncbi:MAG: 4-alpha-glucanotransferase [Oscillospiraceae bacterium]|nr:4-alpha-glucanotransferase [Oscillospiraceae bacterium]